MTKRSRGQRPVLDPNGRQGENRPKPKPQKALAISGEIPVRGARTGTFSDFVNGAVPYCSPRRAEPAELLAPAVPNLESPWR